MNSIHAEKTTQDAINNLQAEIAQYDKELKSLANSQFHSELALGVVSLTIIGCFIALFV